MVVWRCVLDIVFTIKRDSMLIPFPELVEQLKKCLLSVHPKIVIDGMKNVNISRKYMSDVSREPPHILRWLEKDLGLDIATPESLQLLQRKLIEERDEQIDRVQWDKCSVEGRYHDMEVHDDGTMSPLETTEMTQKMEGQEEFARKNLREIMSFAELKEMFPTFPRRALRLYERSPRFDSKTDTLDDSLTPASNKRPYERYPDEPTPNPGPEQLDLEQSHYLGATQRLPPHRREPFGSYEPYGLRKLREVNEATKSTPFKSSTRPESIIPREDTFPEDDVDHLGDVLSKNEGDRLYKFRSREGGAEKA